MLAARNSARHSLNGARPAGRYDVEHVLSYARRFRERGCKVHLYGTYITPLRNCAFLSNRMRSGQSFGRYITIKQAASLAAPPAAATCRRSSTRRRCAPPSTRSSCTTSTTTGGAWRSREYRETEIRFFGVAARGAGRRAARCEPLIRGRSCHHVPSGPVRKFVRTVRAHPSPRLFRAAADSFSRCSTLCTACSSSFSQESARRDSHYLLKAWMSDVATRSASWPSSGTTPRTTRSALRAAEGAAPRVVADLRGAIGRS